MHRFLPFFHMWVYLQTQPLLGLSVTLVAWELAAAINVRAGNKAFTNPTMLAIVMLAALLLMTGTPYAAYFTGAQYVHFLLGPATVALAVPMYGTLPTIRRNFIAIVGAITAGGTVAAGSAMLIAHWLGAPRMVVVSLGPKSVTTPIAMGLSQNLGGQPSLTAAFVMITGIFGTLVCMALFRLVRLQDWRARGLAAGTTAHGLATSHMLLLNQEAGVFSGVAIGLNGIVTSVVLPLLVSGLGL